MKLTKAERREKVGRIIQEAFFPWPPTKWETLSPTQKDEFLECADEIEAVFAGRQALAE